MNADTSAPVEGFASERVRCVVGVGASAGGVESLVEMLQSLPSEAPLAYVIALHTSPTHVSLLTHLLTPRTRLRVQGVQDGVVPQVGTVYVTPPNCDVVLRGGVLCLTASRDGGGPRPSVNELFVSLADELGDKAIGIVLSGTGSDGSIGVRAIKAAGGVIIAQEPTSAKYDGMAQAAILTGGVDLVLAPAAMGSAIVRLSTGALAQNDATAATDDRSEYEQINKLIRKHTSFRLSDYKEATVGRRIARRIEILGLSNLAGYTERLRVDRDEAFALVREMCIGVTEFFRDTEPYRVLQRVIGEMVRSHEDFGVLRVWVAGCATGEEPYSIAMLFEEELLAANKRQLQYMIFASDLDEAALEKARSGLYTAAEVETLPPDLLARHMESQAEQYRVRKSIRNRIVFARQNVTEDPPFARVDLISCRNLLIYLVQSVQKRVLERFHYALNPNGYLFLGRSEAIDSDSPLFELKDTKDRLYRRLESRATYQLRPGIVGPSIALPERIRERGVVGPDQISLRANELLLERYAPPAVVINEQDLVVHFQGAVKHFLDFPQGRAEMSLFNLVDEHIRAELRALVYNARRSGEVVRSGGWSLPVDGHPCLVHACVTPMGPGASSALLVAFESTPLESSGAAPNLAASERDSLIIGELERELSNTRAQLNRVIEELESSNEEYQSLNEELQSTNEELQSSNEELLTTNDELQQKAAEVEKAFEDLSNVKESLALPLIVVDANLRVTQANAACASILLSKEPLEGVSVASVAWALELPNLIETLRGVVEQGESFESDVSAGTATYHMRAMPYRTRHDERKGVVLVFEDVSARRKTEAEIADQRRRLEGILSGTGAGTWEWHVPSGLVRINERWAQIVGRTSSEFAPFTRDTLRAISPHEDCPSSLDAIRKLLSGESPSFELERRVLHKDGHWVWVTDRGSVMSRTAEGLPEWVMGTRLDVTTRKEAELQVAKKEKQLQLFIRNVPTAIAMFDREMRYLEASILWRKNLGVGDKPVVGLRHYDVVAMADAHRESHARALAGETIVLPEVRVPQPDGTHRWNQAIVLPWYEVDGAIGGIIISVDDITYRVEAQRRVEQINEELEHRVQERTLELRSARDELTRTVERLAEAKERLELAANAGLVGVWSVDYVTGIVDFDAVSRGLLELPLEGTLTRANLAPLGETRLANLLAKWNDVKRAAAGNTKFSFDFDLPRLDGTMTTLAVSGNLELDPSGNPLRSLGVFVDVTSRKHLESMLRERAEVAVKAQEQALQRSLQLQKMELVGTLTSGIAHDFNNLISVFSFAVDSLRDLSDPNNAEVNEIIEEMGQAVERALLLTRQLLGFGRAQVAERVPVDVVESVGAIGALLPRLVGGRIVVRIECTGSAWVMGSRAAIEQIVLNLAVNSRDAMPQGGTLVCEVETSEHEVTLVVTDTGKGMDEATRERVFEPFFTTKSTGTGLGLATVAEIVKRFDGTIKIDSAVGRGTTVTVTLPRIDPPASQPRPSMAAPNASTRGRVLLVEDDALVRRSSQRTLEGLGFTVTALSNGKEAFALLQHVRDIDIVVSDISMPERDGESLAELLATTHPTLPVVLFSGNKIPAQRVIEKPFRAFVPKPVSSDDLLAAIERARR